VLQHIVDKYDHKQQPVYAAFVDFRKAYDKVVRQLLWECLHGLGVHGLALDTLKQMYANVMLQVRLESELGTPFQSKMGVKQGDPMSPLLFGLFIDRIEGFMLDKYPGVGVKMMDTLVQVLLYADDLVLMTESPPELQQLLDCLSDFCRTLGLTVNVKKSEVTVFNSRFCSGAQRAAASGITYAGKPLVFAPHFIYLGIMFADGMCISQALARNLGKAKQAAQMMFRRCHGLNIYNVHLQCHLFDSLVRPILNYGCELWGPYVMARKNVAVGVDGDAEIWHRSILRQMVGVRTSVSTAILMHELGRHPLCMAWLKQSLKFWNKACARPESDLLRIAMQESVNMAVVDNARCGWAFNFNALLKNIGARPVYTLERLSVGGHCRLMEGKWRDRLWGKIPGHDCPNRTVPDRERARWKLFVYNRWFAHDDWMLEKSFTYHLFDRKQIRHVAQFRMGVHWLNTEHMNRNIPRSKRHCLCCATATREDEMHIMECPCYSDIRRRYFDTSECEDIGDVAMWHLMNGKSDAVFWEKFANFLLKCRKRRDEILGV
jgi:hypothetical protein